MRSFDQFLAVLNEIPDTRRAEGKLYKLPYLLLFSVLAVITSGNSFRSIETFIKVHRRRLNAAFGLRWKRAPAHTAIRYILQGLHPSREVEWVFRRNAAALRDAATDPSRRTIALDGKTLRRGFENFNDRKAAQVLAAFRRRSRPDPGACPHRGKDQRDPGRTVAARRTGDRPLHHHVSDAEDPRINGAGFWDLSSVRDRQAAGLRW